MSDEEWNLYNHHYRNLYHGGGFQQPNGEISTVLQSVVGPLGDGRYYNIPTAWDGEQLNEQDAAQRAFSNDPSYWPAYSSPEEADARYGEMHTLMDQDVNALADFAAQNGVDMKTLLKFLWDK